MYVPMIILLHSSKTMRSLPTKEHLRKPQLLDKACELDAYLKTLSVEELARIMKISSVLAKKTYELIATWTTKSSQQSLAIDSFIGDIYSGLQAANLTKADRDYADKVLFILSGLYGLIRLYDGICPYRLEMEYKLPLPTYANLYEFWGRSIVSCLPETGFIFNLASVEYSQTVIPFVEKSRIITPKFLTMNLKTGKPVFVTVHAKIARGAFARWLIINRIDDRNKLEKFNDLSYCFDEKMSTFDAPVFVCREFGGKGLSIRSSK